MLFAISDDTWIVLAGMFFACVIQVVSIIWKSSATQKKIEDNTKLTLEAAVQARAAKHVGSQNLEASKEAAKRALLATTKAEAAVVKAEKNIERLDQAAEQIKELQEDSRLRQRKDHFTNGDEPKQGG